MKRNKYKITIVEISTKNSDKFIPLIPNSQRQYLDRANCFCLGALMEDKVVSHPVGVLIFSAENDRGEIDDYSCRVHLLWCYVSTARRYQAVGAALYETFFASLPDHAHIDVTIPASGDYDDLYNYLLGHGFEFHLEDYFELTLSLVDIADNKILQAIYDEPTDVISLADTAPAVWAGFSGYLLSKGLSTAYRDYDPILSSVLMEGTTPVAISLVKKDVSGTVRPVLLDRLPGFEDRSLSSLISYSMDIITDLPISTRVVLSPNSDIDGALIDRFFPNKSPAIVRVGRLDL